MPRKDEWAAAWTCKKILDPGHITDANVVGPNLISINIEEIDHPVKVATISVDVVTYEDIEDICTDPDIEFIMNIKKDAIITGDALRKSQSISVGIGGLGDLYSAANSKEFRNHLPAETKFILRGLMQHTKVTQVERANNRNYHISRHGLPVLKVVALNDYDLTSDSLRDGLERYGPADLILASNPNCRLSGDCTITAKHCGVRVLQWGQLLGAINH